MDHRCRCVDRADEQKVFNHVLYQTLTKGLELGAALIR